MSRVFGRKQDYVPVVKLTDTRYRINFDFVPYEDEGYGWWSTVDYFSLPSNERMKEDVRTLTVARYEADGLEPPQDIDVSAYEIEGAPEFDSGEISDSEALRIITEGL